MCLIVIKDGTPSPDPIILRNAAEANPDGLGILWLDNWEIEKYHSEEWDILTKNPGRDYIAHFRYATVGKVSIKNCHPFAIGNDSYLFQNGTNSNLGSSKMTDTEHMARILRDIPQKFWRDILEVTDSRYVTADLARRMYQIHNKKKWKQDKNKNLYSTFFSSYDRYDYVYSSNSSYKKNKKKNDDFTVGDYVAVYGTLKTGGDNHHMLNSCAMKVYDGCTSSRYPMIVMTTPKLLEKPGLGHYIDVEVYRIWGREIIEKLDYLEDGYTRKRASVTVEDHAGELKEIVCWMYFINNPDHYMKWCTGKYMHPSYSTKKIYV